MLIVRLLIIQITDGRVNTSSIKGRVIRYVIQRLPGFDTFRQIRVGQPVAPHEHTRGHAAADERLSFGWRNAAVDEYVGVAEEWTVGPNDFVRCGALFAWTIC